MAAYLNSALLKLSLFKRPNVNAEEGEGTGIDNSAEATEGSPGAILPSIEEDDPMSWDDNGETENEDEQSEDESEDGDEDESVYEDEDSDGPEDADEDGDEEMDDVMEATMSTQSSSSQRTPDRRGYRKRPNWGSHVSLSAEKKRREDNIVSQTYGWRNEDVALYRALQLRGLQPMIPKSWMLDFPSLPLALFTENEQNTVIKPLRLKHNYASDFHGARALKNLMGVAQQVRERIARPHHVTAELYIKKAMQLYVRWTLLDANICRHRPYLPLITTAIASKNMDPMKLQHRVIKKMQRLRQKWKRALGPYKDATLPPIYGVMVSHSVTAIVTPTSHDDFGEEKGRPHLKDSLRILAMLDWGEDGQDVWSAFAIAILGVHCRDSLVKALQGRELRGVKVEGADEIDGDA